MSRDKRAEERIAEEGEWRREGLSGKKRKMSMEKWGISSTKCHWIDSNSNATGLIQMFVT